jgi:hypothetical protein
LCFFKKTCFGHCATGVQAYIEGPYGAPMIDLHGSHFTCFLIITSGMGWTFLRAWKRQLVQEAARGRPVHVLHTVAVIRRTDGHLAAEFAGWDGIELPDGSDKSTLKLGAQVFGCTRLRSNIKCSCSVRL